MTAITGMPPSRCIATALDTLCPQFLEPKYKLVGSYLQNVPYFSYYMLPIFIIWIFFGTI